MDRREFSLGAAALATTSTGVASAQENISSAARSLYRRAVVLDCNIAPPLEESIPQPRMALDAARNSGVTAVKATLGGFNANFEDTIAEIAFASRVIETHPDVYAQIRGVADIAACKRARKMGVIYSFEGVAMLEDKPDRIELFRNLGVRVMQLSYNQVSPFGAGVLAPADAGLTTLGRDAVTKMNTLGVALDLSHANPKTTAEAMAASQKAVVMTHGGCTAVHGHPRNKTDDQLRALAEKGGVFGIYDLPYLTPSPRQPTLDDYVEHMTHALSVAGEDHVGIGSDTSFNAFDTSPDAMAAFRASVEERRRAGVGAPGEDRPTYVEGLNTPRRCEVIADALLKRGYPARVAEKVLGANFVRVFGEIW